MHARENRRVLLERSRLWVRRSRLENMRVTVACRSRPQRPHRVGRRPVWSARREPAPATSPPRRRCLPSAASSEMRPGVSVSTGLTTFSGISLLPSWKVSRMRVCVASKAGGWSKWCSISISREALRGKSFPWPFPQLRPLPFAERPSERDDQARPPLSKILSKYEFGAPLPIIRSSLPSPRFAPLDGGIPGPTSKIVFREPGIGGVRCDLLKACRRSR